MKTEIKTFEELSKIELFKLLKLRTAIFVVEQECAYQEVDKHDLVARHVLMWDNESLIGYARILPPNSAYKEASIGRVLLKMKQRGKGLGHQLFKEALEHTIKVFPKQDVKVQAQVYLEEFYKSFGFNTTTRPYEDVGIMHVDMVKAG